MKNRFFAILLALAMILSGCHRRSQGTDASPIVRQIVVTEEGSQYFTRRFYNTDEKMQAVLIALRALRPTFEADRDVDALEKTALCLTLTRSDGSVSLYRLVDNRYLRENADTWKQVDTVKAAQLWRLVWEMESDPEASRTFRPSLPRLHKSWIYPHGKNPFTSS